MLLWSALWNSRTNRIGSMVGMVRLKKEGDEIPFALALMPRFVISGA